MPLIGITTSFDPGDEEALLSGKRLLLLGEDYIEAVRSAGGAAVILPLYLPDETPPIIAHLDALLVTGNEKPLPKRLLDSLDLITLRDQSPQRYDSDIGWLQLALSRQMPILGICRGMQTLNAALGGEIRRLPPLPGGRSHAQTAPPQETWHPLQAAPGSLLASALGCTETAVNSFHIQGIATPGQGLIIAGTAPGGTAEAIELRDYPFALGLQFHPERLVKSVPGMAGIFQAFIRAAAAYRRATGSHSNSNSANLPGMGMPVSRSHPAI